MLPPMKNMQRFDEPGTARFITFSCYRRLRLFDNDRIKDRFVERFVEFAALKRVDVLAWVVMPEHVHLVLFPEPADAISAFLSSLKRSFATEVLRRWRELDAGILPRLRDRRGDPHFWQLGGGYDRNVVGDELLEKIRYCHLNPISRGLVASSVDWRWSSARAYETNAQPGDPAFHDLSTSRGTQNTRVGESGGWIGPPIAFEWLPLVDRPLT
jgi:putative transposase